MNYFSREFNGAEIKNSKPTRSMEIPFLEHEPQQAAALPSIKISSSMFAGRRQCSLQIIYIPAGKDNVLLSRQVKDPVVEVWQ